jgi:hypothetical protein
VGVGVVQVQVKGIVPLQVEIKGKEYIYTENG